MYLFLILEKIRYVLNIYRASCNSARIYILYSRNVSLPTKRIYAVDRSPGRYILKGGRLLWTCALCSIPYKNARIPTTNPFVPTNNILFEDSKGRYIVWPRRIYTGELHGHPTYFVSSLNSRERISRTRLRNTPFRLFKSIGYNL